MTTTDGRLSPDNFPPDQHDQVITYNDIRDQDRVLRDRYHSLICLTFVVPAAVGVILNRDWRALTVGVAVGVAIAILQRRPVLRRLLQQRIHRAIERAEHQEEIKTLPGSVEIQSLLDQHAAGHISTDDARSRIAELMYAQRIRGHGVRWVLYLVLVIYPSLFTAAPGRYAGVALAAGGIVLAELVYRESLTLSRRLHDVGARLLVAGASQA